MVKYCLLILLSLLSSRSMAWNLNPKLDFFDVIIIRHYTCTFGWKFAVMVIGQKQQLINHKCDSFNFTTTMCHYSHCVAYIGPYLSNRRMRYSILLWQSCILSSENVLLVAVGDTYASIALTQSLYGIDPDMATDACLSSWKNVEST